MAEQDGGIMQKIQAITAPPHPSPTSKQRRGKAKAINHTQSNSRQSGIDNHPYCDACGDGGDLLCCERCPASFHFVCCDPPLDPLNLPEGEWVCNGCRPLPSNIEGHSNTLFKPLLVQACAENPLIFYLPSNMMTLARVHDVKSERKMAAATNAQTEGTTSNVYCYLCNRNSRHGPMLSCDFCPLSYHMDCLTPPITDSPLPASWMCPNHAEHSIVGLQSIRLSERKKALEKCRADISEHSIKIDFLNRLKSIPHYKRITTRTNRRVTQVPDGIKDMYSHPLTDAHSVTPLSQLLLTATEHLQLLRRESERERLNLKMSSSTSTLTQAQNEWTIDNTLERLGIPRQPHVRTTSTREDLQEILQATPTCNGISNDNKTTPTNAIIPNVELLDEKFIKLLATQRLQQLLSPPSPPLPLPHYKTINGLKQFDPSTLSTSSSVTTSTGHHSNTVRGSTSGGGGMKRKRDFNPLGILCPLTTAGPAVPILTTSITIGSSSEMDVCLANYGHCNYVSSHHACLIYNKESKEYELINYSEHGSIVDGVLYSCDFSEKTSYEGTVLLLDDVLSLGEGRKAINAKRRLEMARTNLQDTEKAKHVLSSALKLSKSINKDASIDPKKVTDLINSNNNKRLRNSSSSEPSSPESSIVSLLPSSSKFRQSPFIDSKGQSPCPQGGNSEKTSPSHLTNRHLKHKQSSNNNCLCKRSASSLIGASGKGWEGSALVSHGSKLRFGCIQLMLSVADRHGHNELIQALNDAHLL